MQPNAIFKELYPASMNDIRVWNIREMRICIEWGKTFEAYQRLNPFDQVGLTRGSVCDHRIMPFLSLPLPLVVSNGGA